MALRGERVTAEAFGQVPRLSLRLVLDNLRSGQNVGACFRSADAFRIDGLDLCGITCHPPHRDILKSALGSSSHVPWTAHESTLEAVQALQSQGWKVASVEQAPTSIALDAWRPAATERWALVLGNEVRGGPPRSVGRVRRHPRDATIWREAEHQRQRLCRNCLVASSLDDATVTHQ